MSAHTVIPTINVFILKGQSVLLGRRANTGWADGALCPPGGHIEPQETPIQACIREVQEELGVTVQPQDLEFLAIAARQTTEGETVGYEFAIRDRAYRFVNAEPDRCSELVWADVTRLPDDLIEDFRLIMQACLIDNKRYIEQGY